MISFVVWKWTGPDPARSFTAEHVNVLRAAIGRNCTRHHRLICITDDPSGLDRRIEALAPPRTHLDDLPPPRTMSGAVGAGARRFPSCYRRLWNFSLEAASVLGPRIVALDIDVVVCGSLDPLLDRDADFVGWCDPRFGWRKIAGGAYMLRTGTQRAVWDDFDPVLSPRLALAAGLHGSDQAWMSYKLFPPASAWSSDDGVIKLGWLPPGRRATPPGICLAFTAGHSPPWNPKTQRIYPWIRDHWRP